MKNKFGLITLAAIMSSGLFVSTTTVTRAEQTDKITVDGRFGSKCFNYGGGSSGSKVGVCDISFYKLIATPEVFNKNDISITGYLISSFGDLVLFPSKSSYLGGKDVEGVKLGPPFKISNKILKAAKNGIYPIRVIGYFNAHYGGSRTSPPRLGLLSGIKDVAFSQRIPSGDETNMDGIKVVQ